MTNMNQIIISVLQRKALDGKTKTKHSQLGLLYSAKHFVMYCNNGTIDLHFWCKHYKSICG